MDKEITITLGLEEFAVAIRVAGRMEEAQGLLLSHIGKIPSNEERGRLLAAHHSLMARGFLSIKNDNIELDPFVKDVINTIFSAQKVIRSGKTGVYGEDVLSYYLSNGRWVEHLVMNSVIHRFKFIMDTEVEEIEKQIITFFSPICNGWVETNPVDLPDSFLTDLDLEARRSFDKILSYISNSAPPNSSMELLAQDFTNAEWRGSIMWIKSKGPESILSKGSLLVQGKDRLWMINSSISNQTENFQAKLIQIAHFKKYIKDIVSFEPTYE